MINFAELDAHNLVDRAAATLQAQGVRAQEVVAICAANSIEYVVVFLGALRACIVVTPLAPTATASSLGMMLRDSGAKILFLDAAVANLLSSLQDPAPIGPSGCLVIASGVLEQSVLQNMEARPAPAEAAELPPVRVVEAPTPATTLSPMHSIAPVRRKRERKRRHRDAVRRRQASAS